ncbi:MAG: DEAD/DEAH box helicase [Bacteroidales bacterium]|jgi:ATP-dependent RNA helicase DeaD|nr:DEAD/DEAH box helicase [Bacteroidales bacterium]
MITFEDLDISPLITKALYELGFEYPMPVQEKVIPLLLKNETDIVALAQTGTGKTAAFGIPVIQGIDPDKNYPQALILAPTRELCVQIADDLQDYSKYIDDVRILAVYGGSSIEMQINALKKGVHIIVATPGRLCDLIQRKKVILKHVKKVILDEADEMLHMGFIDSINEILAQVPKERNTLLFSATMPKEVAGIAKDYMTDPEEITIGKKNSGAEHVKHICYTVHARDKYQTLKRIADYHPNIYGIVFCRTRKETQDIADSLIQDGYNADALHGDLSQSQRDYVMQKFRNKNLQLLVATDVAARGLDVDNLTHVINYNLPDDPEVYTHRSGRTGRAGKPGVSIAIVNLKEKHLIRRIEKMINKSFEMAEVPTGREICEKQLFHLIDKVEKVEVDHAQIESYLPAIYRKLEWFDKQDLIQRFVSLEFNRFLSYYRDAADIISESEFKGKKQERSKRLADTDYTRLYINLGRKDRIAPPSLIEMVNEVVPGAYVPIGRIDIYDTYSYFEVATPYAAQIMNELKQMAYRNRPLNLNYASEDNKSAHKKKPGNKNEKTWNNDKRKDSKRKNPKNENQTSHRRR